MVAALVRLLHSGIQDQRLLPKGGPNIDAAFFIRVLVRAGRFTTKWHRLDFQQKPQFGKTAYCQLVTKEVGDLYGRTKPDVQKPGRPSTWIEGQLDPGWPPRQTKWIQKLDKDDYPVWLSEADFNARPKTHTFEGKLKPGVKEGFVAYDSSIPNKLAAFALLLALAASFSLL
jgi:hypothetical protein